MEPEAAAQALADIIRQAVPGLEFRIADDLLVNRCRAFLEQLRTGETGWQ
jgi:hypothetical protein